MNARANHRFRVTMAYLHAKAMYRESVGTADEFYAYLLYAAAVSGLKGLP